jgi:hypothetical protein
VWWTLARALAEEPAAKAADLGVDFGWLCVDARVPTEVAVDGHRVAELIYPAELRVGVPSGSRTVRTWVHGEARDLRIDVPVNGEAHVLVGRSGVSAGAPPTVAPPEPVGPSDVQIRVVGDAAVQIRVDRQRWQVGAGDMARVTLAAGAHEMSVRSPDGTVVWATGQLEVGGPLVLHVAEGRAIEVSGPGRFEPAGG